jgi:hypothetical protein
MFTVCLMTFQKGRVVLGIFGTFLPFLWLISAVLPDRNGPAPGLSGADRLRRGGPVPASRGQPSLEGFHSLRRLFATTTAP